MGGEGNHNNKDKGLLSNLAGYAAGATHNHQQHGGGGYPPQGYPPQQGYPPAGYPGQSDPHGSGGHGSGIGGMLAGGAAAYGAHKLSSSHGYGGHNVSHGVHNMIPGMGMGHYSGGKHGKHGGGKFMKHGKHGKGAKHGKFGKHKGKILGFKKWK